MVNAPTSGSYTSYAEKIANLVWGKMRDTTYGGIYSEVSENWNTVTSTEKSLLGNTFVTRGYLQLYRRTKNSTYLSWAENIINTLWTKCWNQTGNLGFFDSYYNNWARKRDYQTLQQQAEFVHVSLEAYNITSNSMYYQWANQTMQFIMDMYHDNTYGAMYKTRNGVTGAISDTNKHIESSLGAFSWAAMKWYSYTHNQRAKQYSQESVDWMKKHLWNATTSGYMTETNSIGTVTNSYYYPNVEMWGMVGMMEFYKQTLNSTVRSWIREGLTHVNNTMWDTTYGGWYRKLKPDNSILQDTKTGWDNAEQPWFWYHAYKVMGNSIDLDTAIRSLNWTRDHVWDSVNGGLWLEVHRNGTTVSFNTKNDWVEGGATVAFAYVTIIGDVNSDCIVDASDLFDLSEAYGSTPDSPHWNPNCDLNGDNKVDASDLFDLSKNYGKTCP